MNKHRSHASSRNRLAGFEWLSLTLAALLALPPAAFAMPRGADSARSLSAAGSATQAGFLYTVNTTGDAAGLPPISQCDTDIFTPGEQCTLRAALQATNAVAGEDTITFNIPATAPGCDAATGRCVINLTQALPDITEGIAITGPGADKLTVRGNTGGGFRIFSVATMGTVFISRLTVSNGFGGIINLGLLNVTDCIISDNSDSGILNAGTMSVTGSTISNNRSSRQGAGISNQGTLNVTNSTISGNEIFGSSPPIFSQVIGGGGIYNAGTLNVTNSTVSGNSAKAGPPTGFPHAIGGGILTIGAVNITNSTLSGNMAVGLATPNSQGIGGGIAAFASINAKNTIIANNTTPTNNNTTTTCGPDICGPLTSQGYNLIEDTSGATITPAQPTDIFGVDPKLDPAGLQNNGGATHTIALLPASPAIDKGTADGLTGMLTTDQRGAGFPRTVDDPAIPPATDGDNTDIGAFELQPPPINAGNALLINESCPPANGAIDPGERVTVNLELMNTSNAATSNLVATLQSSGGVLAPSGPQSYGAISVNSSAARDFSFTVPGNISSGETITATLQLQDGANNLGTVSFNFTAGPTPCSFVRLVATSSLSRADASTVVGAITVRNIGSLAANAVTLTTAKLGATNGTPLPQGLGNLAPGDSASVMVNFNNSTPGASSMLTLGGTYSGGTFSSNKRVTIPACSPGAPGCGWEDGDIVSYSQDSWGGDPTMSTAAGILAAHFNSIYGGGVEVGFSGNAGFSMIFTSAAAVLNYLPSSASPAPLNADHIDPTSTSSGLFGGFVLALQFNVDFADADRISGTSGLVYGDLRLCGLSSTPAYNGLTIRQFLSEMNTALGAGPVAYTYDDVAALTSDVSTAFESGSVSIFAQQHLVSGPACP